MQPFVDLIVFIGCVETLFLLLYAARYYIFTFVVLKAKSSSSPKIDNHSSYSFVTVLLPLYNEPNVVDRLLKFCTSFDFSPYEVIVIDDSTDETTEKLAQWKDHPKIKIIHRNSRDGWKGGALNAGLEHINPESTHTIILDADFVPPADLLQRFLASFTNDQTVAVQGYQLHDLNAEENWVTKGIRIMYSVNNMVELSAKDKLGLLLPLTGSVYMVRTDILRKMRFNGDLTEDWNLTLRLYEAGYKVVYDSTLTASAECSNTIMKFLRQTSRWAEGHTRDFRKHFWKILRSRFFTVREKFEFLFQGCLYLNSIPVVALTIGGFLALPSLTYSLSLPSTHLSLLFTVINASSLIFAIIAALVREGMIKDFSKMPYTLILGYLTTPIIAYASLKGLLTGHGYFHRTYKTGKITKIPVLRRLRKRFK